MLEDFVVQGHYHQIKNMIEAQKKGQANLGICSLEGPRQHIPTVLLSIPYNYLPCT